MLKIRFQRTGRKNDPSFRIVVGEHTKHPKSGAHAETLGSYQPKTKTLSIDEAKVKLWMEKGAKPSPTVHNLLISKGIIEGTKINVLPKKSPIVKEEEPKEETPQDKKSEDAPSEEEVNADETTEEAPKEEEKAEEAEAPQDLPAQAGEEKKEEPAA